MKRVTKFLLSCRTLRDSIVQPLRYHQQINKTVMNRVSVSAETPSSHISEKSLTPIKNETFIMYLDQEMRDQLVYFLNKHSSKSDLYNKDNYMLMMTKTSQTIPQSEKLGPLICLEEMNQALLNADPILKTQVNILNDMKRLLNIMKDTTKNAKLDDKIAQIDQQIADVILLSKNNHRLTKQYSHLKNMESGKNLNLDDKKATMNFKDIFQNSGNLFWKILSKHKLLDSHIRTIYNKRMQVLCTRNKLMDVNYASLAVAKPSSGKLLRNLSPKCIKSKLFLNDNLMFLNAMRTDFKDFMWGIQLLSRSGRLENSTNDICDKLNKVEKSKEELQQIILDASQSVMRLNKRFAENVRMLVKIEKLLRNICKSYKFDNYQTFLITYFLKEKLRVIKNSFLNDCTTICLNKKYLRLFEKTALNETLYEEQKEIFVNDCKRMFSVVYGSNSGKSIQNIFTNSYFSSSSQKMVLQSKSTLQQPMLKKSCSDIDLKPSRNFSSNPQKELFFSAELKETIPPKEKAEITIKDLLPVVDVKKTEIVVQKIDLNKVFVEQKPDEQKLLKKEISVNDKFYKTKKSKRNQETTTVRNASTQESGMKFMNKKKQKSLESKVILVKETDSKSIKTDVIRSQDFEKIGIDEGTQSQIKSVSTDLNPTIEKQTTDQNIGTETEEVKPTKVDIKTRSKSSSTDVQKTQSKSVQANKKILDKIRANRERNFAQPHSWKELPEFPCNQMRTRSDDLKRESLKTKKHPKSAVPVPQPKIECKFTFSKPESRRRLQTVKDIKYPDISKAKKFETKTEAPKKVLKIFTCQTPSQTDENLEVKSQDLKDLKVEGSSDNVNPPSKIAELIKTLPDDLEQRLTSPSDTDSSNLRTQLKNFTDRVKAMTLKRIRSTESFKTRKLKSNVSFDKDMNQCQDTLSRKSLEKDTLSKSSGSSKQRLPKMVALKSSFSRKFSFDKIPLRRKESSVSLVKGKLFPFKHYSNMKSSTLLSKDNVDNPNHFKTFQGSKYKKSGKWGVDLSLSGQTPSSEQVRYKGSTHSLSNDNMNRTKK